MVNIYGTRIMMTRGDTLRCLIKLTKGDEPYELQDGDQVRFALKKNYKDEEPLIVKNIASDLILELEPQDTKDLKVDTYYYDIEMTYADGAVDTFIAEARLELRNEVY